MTVIIDGLSIVYGEELELIYEGSITIDNGKVSFAGEGSAPSSQNSSTTLNGRGLLAIPGLIDAHTHLADSVAKDVGIGSKLDALVHPLNGLKSRILNETPPSILSQALASTANQMLASGVTTFADFREGGLDGVQLARRALAPVRSHGMILGRPNYHFTRDTVTNSQAELSEQTLAELRETVEGADGLGISGANEYTDAALVQISKMSKTLGKEKPLGVHACESAESTQFSTTNFSKSEVERALFCLEPDFLVHLTNARKEDLDLVARKRVPVACCPRANAMLGLGLPPICELLESGVTVALGTDNVMLASPDMFREMEFTSRMLRASRHDPGTVSSRTVLKMATVNAAKALGLGEKAGSIEAGKNADIVFLDLSKPNLAFSRDLIGSVVHRAGPEDVSCVMVDGEIAYGTIPAA